MKQRKKRLKSYTVETQSSPLRQIWHAFDQYISLFVVPLFIFIRAIIFIQTNEFEGFAGVIAGIWILFAIISAIVVGIFFFVNKYLLKWKVNWWKNLLFSFLISAIGSFIFGLIIRLSS